MVENVGANKLRTKHPNVFCGTSMQNTKLAPTKASSMKTLPSQSTPAFILWKIGASSDVRTSCFYTGKRQDQHACCGDLRGILKQHAGF